MSKYAGDLNANTRYLNVGPREMPEGIPTGSLVSLSFVEKGEVPFVLNGKPIETGWQTEGQQYALIQKNHSSWYGK